MKSFHIPRTALFFILFALAAFAVLYHPIDLKALVRASSQGTLRTEEVAHFGSTNDMDYHLLLQYIWNRIWQPVIFHSSSFLSYNKRVIG